MVKKVALLFLKLFPEQVSEDLKSTLIVFYKKRKRQSILKKIIEWSTVNIDKFNIILYDLGARSDLHPLYVDLNKNNMLEGFGFEPGKKESEILKDQSLFKKVISKAIGGKAGKRTIYITKRPGCSSLYEPNCRNIKNTRVHEYFKVLEQIDIEVDTLDNVMKDFDIPFPDFIKMDIQGAEFEVLESMGNRLNKVIGIHLESHMREIYKGEGLFCEIHELLIDKGFSLIRNTHHDNFEGEVLEVEVAYVNRAHILNTKSNVIKAVLFSLVHKNVRYAAMLVRTSGLSSALKKQLLKLLDQPIEPITHTYAPDMKTGW